MPRHPRFAVVVALAALAGLSPVTRADRYDTPIVSVSEVSRSSITLEVTAGATGLPAGFGVDWMTRANFISYGWDGAGMYYCNFTGLPTYNNWPGSLGYALGPFQTGWIEVGDLFDETGVETDYNIELSANVEYVFRAYGLGDLNGEASYYTSTRIGTTLTQGAESNCIRTQGYWKNHPEVWPVQSLTLGNVTYTKAQLLLILNNPALGNGLLILAHQLIATKLNLANGGSSGPISSFVDDADGLIGNLVVPPIGGGYLDPNTVQTPKDQLDDYNNGRTAAQCAITASKPATWGRIKTLYR